jgi:hypothetical protein
VEINRLSGVTVPRFSHDALSGEANVLAERTCYQNCREGVQFTLCDCVDPRTGPVVFDGIDRVESVGFRWWFHVPTRIVLRTALVAENLFLRKQNLRGAYKGFSPFSPSSAA